MFISGAREVHVPKCVAKVGTFCKLCNPYLYGFSPSPHVKSADTPPFCQKFIIGISFEEDFLETRRHGVALSSRLSDRAWRDLIDLRRRNLHDGRVFQTRLMRFLDYARNDNNAHTKCVPWEEIMTKWRGVCRFDMQGG